MCVFSSAFNQTKHEIGNRDPVSEGGQLSGQKKSYLVDTQAQTWRQVRRKYANVSKPVFLSAGAQAAPSCMF